MHNRRVIVSARSSRIGIIMVPASRRLVVTSSAVSVLGGWCHYGVSQFQLPKIQV